VNSTIGSAAEVPKGLISVKKDVVERSRNTEGRKKSGKIESLPMTGKSRQTERPFEEKRAGTTGNVRVSTAAIKLQRPKKIVKSTIVKSRTGSLAMPKGKVPDGKE